MLSKHYVLLRDKQMADIRLWQIKKRANWHCTNHFNGQQNLSLNCKIKMQNDIKLLLEQQQTVEDTLIKYT